MTADQRLTVILVIFSVLFIPLLTLLYRSIVRWTRASVQLENIAQDLENLVRDKDTTHKAMYNTMRQDRETMDKRIRWLEEFLWKREREGK